MLVGEIEYREGVLLLKLDFQDTIEEIIELEEAIFVENREVNFINYILVYFIVLEKLLENKERKDDYLLIVILIFFKEICVFEIVEEVNVSLDFFFGFLIEEVLLVFSFDFLVLVEEIQSFQVLFLCSLKFYDIQCEKSDKFFQIELVDLVIVEKENFFVGFINLVGQVNLIQV